MSNNLFKITIGFNVPQETGLFGFGSSRSYTIQVSEKRKDELLSMYEKGKAILPIRLGDDEAEGVIYINMRNINYITIKPKKEEKEKTDE